MKGGTQVWIGRRKTLIFDGDASQWADGGSPCSLCGRKVTLEEHCTLIRVRERVPGESESKTIGFVCPDCVGRMFLQVTRLDLWAQVSATVIAAIKQQISKRLRPKLIGRSPE